MSQVLTTSLQSWGIYAPQEVPLGDKGECPLFVAKELFPGSGEPVWFRLGRLRDDVKGTPRQARDLLSAGL
jgi:hypothetical protein